MGWWRAVLGRPSPAPSHCEQLAGLVSASARLQHARGYLPTGNAAIAIAAPLAAEVKSSVAAAMTAADLAGESASQTITTALESDEYGYAWLVVTTHPPDATTVVTALQRGVGALATAGMLDVALCIVVSYRDQQGHPLGIIYRFAEKNFYPFVPVPGVGTDSEPQRDNLTELMVRELVSELALERDVSRWYPLWNAPGMR